MLANKRKISAGPDLQPIFENEDVVEKFEYNVIVEPFPSMGVIKHTPVKIENRPPQAPRKNKMAAGDQIDYVNNALSWLQTELELLKREDKEPLCFYKNLMTTVNNLKRVTTTFKEQSDTLCKIPNSIENAEHDKIRKLNSSTNTLEKGICEQGKEKSSVGT